MTALRSRGAAVGLLAAVLLIVLAVVVPPLTGWQVNARTGNAGTPPLNGAWQPRVGWASLVALALAGVGVWLAPQRARTLAWGRLMLISYAVGLAWLLSLALIDGLDGLTRVLAAPSEYLGTARSVTDVGLLLEEFIERIPNDHPRRWPTHVAGHPPGAVLFFVMLDRLGLGSDLAAALVVTAIAATIPLATAQTLRLLGAEAAARRALPFLVLSPAAVYLAVSADAVFSATAAWGLCALAAATSAQRRADPVTMLAWSLVSGLAFGTLVLMSYGLALVGFIALGVLAAARTWRPMWISAGTALAVVLGFAAAGFAWWEAFPVLRERYLIGLASVRPAEYWVWANLAGLLVSAGPALGSALGHLAVTARRAERAVVAVALGAVVAVLAADLSLMSKAEVERIWLPFIPWLLVATAALPPRWARPSLALQVATALALAHLVNTFW